VALPCSLVLRLAQALGFSLLFSQRAFFFLCDADEQYFFFPSWQATTYSALLALLAGLQHEQALEI
jgi:hypothetical protein